MIHLYLNPSPTSGNLPVMAYILLYIATANFTPMHSHITSFVASSSFLKASESRLGYTLECVCGKNWGVCMHKDVVYYRYACVH